ncbi:hypothetical protein C8F04DRAFT_1331658 [Mycena alexandri]|uniref:Uncharacterized protein n=1 Tax=Mycena alexandri TaxID=1745969 RepID=A0AAD6T083_9AGAR|nr:hypothetical protein C8F04DRAFT_1331658 [Mycena alexandri]
MAPTQRCLSTPTPPLLAAACFEISHRRPFAGDDLTRLSTHPLPRPTLPAPNRRRRHASAVTRRHQDVSRPRHSFVFGSLRSHKRTPSAYFLPAMDSLRTLALTTHLYRALTPTTRISKEAALRNESRRNSNHRLAGAETGLLRTYLNTMKQRLGQPSLHDWIADWNPQKPRALALKQDSNCGNTFRVALPPLETLSIGKKGNTWVPSLTHSSSVHETVALYRFHLHLRDPLGVVRFNARQCWPIRVPFYCFFQKPRFSIHCKGLPGNFPEGFG